MDYLAESISNMGQTAPWARKCGLQIDVCGMHARISSFTDVGSPHAKLSCVLAGRVFTLRGPSSIPGRNAQLAVHAWDLLMERADSLVGSSSSGKF